LTLNVAFLLVLILSPNHNKVWSLNHFAGSSTNTLVGRKHWPKPAVLDVMSHHISSGLGIRPLRMELSASSTNPTQHFKSIYCTLPTFPLFHRTHTFPCFPFARLLAYTDTCTHAPFFISRLSPLSLSKLSVAAPLFELAAEMKVGELAERTTDGGTTTAATDRSANGGVHGGAIGVASEVMDNEELDVDERDLLIQISDTNFGHNNYTDAERRKHEHAVNWHGSRCHPSVVFSLLIMGFCPAPCFLLLYPWFLFTRRGARLCLPAVLAPAACACRLHLPLVQW
jgi:hypothetical protein